MPSCIRAPPEALKMITGLPSFVANSMARVIFSPTTDPIDAIMQVPTVAWAQFVVFCGAIEANKYNWAKGEGPMTDPSKPFFDPLGLYPTDAAGQEKMQLRELKNARVAMIGFAGLFVNHFMPGAVPGLGGFH